MRFQELTSIIVDFCFTHFDPHIGCSPSCVCLTQRIALSERGRCLLHRGILVASTARFGAPWGHPRRIRPTPSRRLCPMLPQQRP
jgi:hypothetical protein